MQKKRILNKKEKQLVYLSASLSSGCHPCARYHFRKSSELRIKEDLINNTLSLAISIRDNATRFMEKLVHNQKSLENKKEENPESLTRNDILVGIAASYSINFPLGLEKYLNIARKSGINNGELIEIINLSKTVVDMARAHVDMLADKKGIKQKAENKEDSCCIRD